MLIFQWKFYWILEERAYNDYLDFYLIGNFKILIMYKIGYRTHLDSMMNELYGLE